MKFDFESIFCDCPAIYRGFFLNYVFDKANGMYPFKSKYNLLIGVSNFKRKTSTKLPKKKLGNNIHAWWKPTYSQYFHYFYFEYSFVKASHPHVTTLKRARAFKLSSAGVHSCKRVRQSGKKWSGKNCPPGPSMEIPPSGEGNNPWRIPGSVCPTSLAQEEKRDFSALFGVK